jgi:lysophospholipase L1-like esterase
MIKSFGIGFAILCSISASCLSASAANPPKVVFIGDYITAQWPLPAAENWVNLGVNAPDSYGTRGDSGDWAQNFQAQVVPVKPNIVHIMVGAEDAALEDDGTIPLINSLFVQNIQSIVQQAKAAGITVILGTEIPSAPGNLGNAEMNGFLLAYGAANGIPVVNYANALYGYAEGQYWPPITTGTSYQPQPYLTTDTGPFGPEVPLPIPSAAGYSLMSQMAANAIASIGGAKLRSGYLQTIGFGMGRSSDFPTPVFNQNTVAPGYSLQFTPMGTYSDGGTRPLLNSNIAGASGTWTSNNPAVMFVNSYGYAEALSPGTAWIYYTSPEGVSFSPWVMTVSSATPPGI